MGVGKELVIIKADDYIEKFVNEETEIWMSDDSCTFSSADK